MAAPVGIKWGDVLSVGDTLKGKIGIYVSVKESTETNVKFHVEVWFATMYSCYDGSNTLKFNAGDDVSSASTVVTSNKSISHDERHDAGAGWHGDNQTKLYAYDRTTGYDRRHTNRTIKFYASFSGIAMLNNKTMYANTSYTIAKKDSYTITFNANGGSGAPSKQTKWYGETLTLSSTKPTRTGYIFKGWGTSSTATSATWSAGGSYTKNESDTLYAVWQAKTYTVTYNANGGSGAPAKQTKTYGKALTLSSAKPTRTNYNFVGWATSSTATTAVYNAGESYTTNASITLYAVWNLAYSKPRITNFSVSRVNQNGQIDDQGTICKVIFDWATDNQVQTITVSYRQATTGTNWNDVDFPPELVKGTSGSVNQTPFTELSISNSYEIKVTVKDGTDESHSSYVTRTLPSAKFLLDFKAGGDGIAIGKAAENAGFDVYMDTKFEKNVAIYGETPHLDFHFANSTSDFTSSIIAESSGKVNILANAGLFNNGQKVVLKSDLATSNIELSVYKDPNSNVLRLRNFSYTAKYVPAIPAVFVRIYGIINDDMNAGNDYTIVNIASNGPNWRTALSAKGAKQFMAEAKSDSIVIRPFESGIKNYEVYIAGFWFV